MKSLFFVVILMSAFFSSSNLYAQANVDRTFDFESVLLKAYPGNPNTKIIDINSVKSIAVKQALQNVDFAFEMGDGYYDVASSALYMVFTGKGKLAGFMKAALLTYTEDPDLFLVAAFVDAGGVRVGELFELNRYFSINDPEINLLPIELRISR